MIVKRREVRTRLWTPSQCAVTGARWTKLVNLFRKFRFRNVPATLAGAGVRPLRMGSIQQWSVATGMKRYMFKGREHAFSALAATAPAHLQKHELLAEPTV